MPSGGCQGATFSQEGGPCGGQRASQTHGELPPSIFLMALSHFIIDFNSAMCRARGKQGLCDVTPAQTAGRGPIPKQVAGERSYTNGHICCYGKLGRPSIRLSSTSSLFYYAIERAFTSQLEERLHGHVTDSVSP